MMSDVKSKREYTVQGQQGSGADCWSLFFIINGTGMDCPQLALAYESVRHKNKIKQANCALILWGLTASWTHWQLAAHKLADLATLIDPLAAIAFLIRIVVYRYVSVFEAMHWWIASSVVWQATKWNCSVASVGRTGGEFWTLVQLQWDKKHVRLPWKTKAKAKQLIWFQKFPEYWISIEYFRDL